MNSRTLTVEISALKEHESVLDPFHEAMEVEEGQKVTISDIGLVIQGYKHSLENLIHN